MLRRMLIIANPGRQGEENYCEGVNKDVTSYQNFFTSKSGGAWEESEIRILKQPFPWQVDSALQWLIPAAYSMVIFCGHGYSRKDGTTVVELKSGYDYDSEKFFKGADKHSVILDCCRAVVEEELLEHAREDGTILFEREINRETARKRFDEAVSRCSSGQIILYSCDLEETAGDDSRNGGVYSHALRTAADAWSKSRSDEEYASIVAIHNTASVKVRNLSGGRQNPQICKPRTTRYFPFAVSLLEKQKYVYSL